MTGIKVNPVIEQWNKDGVPEEWQRRAILEALAVWDLSQSFKEKGMPVPMMTFGTKTMELVNSFAFKDRAEFSEVRAKYLETVTPEDFEKYYLNWIIKEQSRALL